VQDDAVKSGSPVYFTIDVADAILNPETTWVTLDTVSGDTANFAVDPGPFVVEAAGELAAELPLLPHPTVFGTLTFTSEHIC